MKRISTLLLICFLCLSLFGCEAKPRDISAALPFPPVNFNNDHWPSEDFWAFEDTIFYSKDGFYNMGFYLESKGKASRLFQESDFSQFGEETIHITDIFPCQNTLYFVVGTEDTDRLYGYDLAKKTYLPICEVPSTYCWAVAGDYFIYREHPANYEDRRAPLYVYGLIDGTTTQICANTEAFSLVDGQLRYLTYGDTYNLYAYDFADNQSTLLGTFSGPFHDECDYFNFTADGVVIVSWNREYRKELGVYTVSSDTMAVYTMPKEIHYLVAADRCAYAVLYDAEEYSSDAISAKENGIYRINLADGSYELVVQNADNRTKLHVITDDRFYIVQGDLNSMGRYKRHVYKFDYATKEKVKLATI